MNVFSMFCPVYALFIGVVEIKKGNKIKSNFVAHGFKFNL